MYKHTITYTDFNDNECKEALYFNINKRELNEMSRNGFLDVVNNARKKIEVQDYEGIDFYSIVSRLVSVAYGRKSEDGKRFIKDPAERYAFEDSCAFEAMVDELLEKPDLAKNFILGVIPKSLSEKAAAEFEKNEEKLTAQLNA